MNFSERLRLRRARPRPTTDAQPAPADGPLPSAADGTSTADLGQPAVPQPTMMSTTMICPNCEGGLRTARLDMVARTAEMRCPDCGFAFAHRLPANR